MKKLSTLILFVSVLSVSIVFFSCSKNETSDNTNKKQDNNTQNTTQQTTKNSGSWSNPNSNTTGSSPASFEVKNIGSADKKKEMVDFAWNENGKDVKLSDFKGKVIVLNFWATWCGPCKKELPSLSQLSTDLKDKNFKMIGVSVDNDQTTADSFLKSNNLSYTILHEPKELLSKYMSVAGVSDDVIPQTFIIDKNGKIVESLIGSRSKEDFMTIINKYL